MNCLMLILIKETKRYNTFKRLYLLLIYLFINAICFSQSFTSTPITYVRELDDYQYWITVASPGDDTFSISYIKKPEWLNIYDNNDNSAELYGVPIEGNYPTYTDSVVISASSGDTTIYQKFAIYVDYVVTVPEITERPDTVVYSGTENYDTLVVWSFKPEYLEFVIVEKPDWIDITKFQESLDTYFIFYCNPPDSLINKSDWIDIEFSYGSSGDSFTQKIFVLSPSSLPNQEMDTHKLTIYPNPARKVIYLRDYQDRILSHSIISSTGQQMKIQRDNNVLYIGELPPGMYFLSVTLDNNQVINSLKFIKN